MTSAAPNELQPAIVWWMKECSEQTNGERVYAMLNSFSSHLTLLISEIEQYIM